MAINPPSRGKPRTLTPEGQVDRELICMIPIPEIGPVDKAKFAPGKFAQKTIKAGK
jgi:hypothetical protein